jgi:hypothetical protein
MTDTAKFRRGVAACGLITAALLTIPYILWSPEFPDGFAERLAAFDAAGASATLSAFAFVLAQLPFIAAVLGIGRLLRDRAPILAVAGPGLAVIGAFGHSVAGGVALVSLAMAPDVVHRSAHAAVLEAVESGPAVAFMAMGLLGTVLGLLLLASGLWRARARPRWAGPALGAFLVIEFVGTAVSDWAAPLAGALYVATLLVLAVTVSRSPVRLWRAESDDASAPLAPEVAAART